MWNTSHHAGYAWGEQLLFKPFHLPVDRLEIMRMEIDYLGDDALIAATERSLLLHTNGCRNCRTDDDFPLSLEVGTEPPIHYRLCGRCRPVSGDRIYISFIAGDNGHFFVDKRLNDFWRSVATVPDWVDWNLIQRGQELFFRYSTSAAMGLLYFSLIGGLSAPKIVKVLDSTSYMTQNEDRTWLRLNETLQMVIDALDSPEALKPGNAGWAAVLKVNLRLYGFKHIFAK